MGAHAHPVQAASIGTRPSVRRWRPPRRTSLVLAVALTLVGLVANAGAVQAAAVDLCTAGTPAGTTCGEALVLLGYP